MDKSSKEDLWSCWKTFLDFIQRNNNDSYNQDFVTIDTLLSQNDFDEIFDSKLRDSNCNDIPQHLLIHEYVHNFFKKLHEKSYIFPETKVILSDIYDSSSFYYKEIIDKYSTISIIEAWKKIEEKCDDCMLIKQTIQNLALKNPLQMRIKISKMISL